MRSPATRMTFKLEDIQYLVFNDGGVELDRLIPVSFQVLL